MTINKLWYIEQQLHKHLCKVFHNQVWTSNIYSKSKPDLYLMVIRMAINDISVVEAVNKYLKRKLGIACNYIYKDQEGFGVLEYDDLTDKVVNEISIICKN